MKPSNAGLDRELGTFARQRGADLFGIADLAPAKEFLRDQGNSVGLQYPRAVSLGLRLSDVIVDLHDPNEPRRESLYWHHVYGVVTPALDFLAYDVARWLTDRGFQAFPVPGSSPYDFTNLRSAFSHKLAAHLAGLGWIGKSCLLLTGQFGPRARLVTVLTDAPLETGRARDGRCGACRLCVEACPVGAIKGAEFEVNERLETRLDGFKCSEYRREHPCGRCISSCPVGRRK